MNRWLSRAGRRPPRRPDPSCRLGLARLQCREVPAGAAFPLASGPRLAPQVIAYNDDGTVRFGLHPYSAGFLGRARVATGDVTGDRVRDVVTAAGPGGGRHVRVFDGNTGALV